MTVALVEEDDRWVLPLEGRTVVRCLVDYGFGLLLDGEADVEISLTTFRFRDRAGHQYALDSEGDRRALAPALACFGLVVEQAVAWKSGALEIIFTDGTRIEAEPHEQYESWQVSGPQNVLLVSPAGGREPAVWDGGGRTDRSPG